mmetsp:Transcript_23091/g.48689  ORF Transcript_23091/g.48689 Transcript_23091/m.48689 type:complete len:117 (-) Transcript_23091:65-415(-)
MLPIPKRAPVQIPSFIRCHYDMVRADVLALATVAGTRPASPSYISQRSGIGCCRWMVMISEDGHHFDLRSEDEDVDCRHAREEGGSEGDAASADLDFEWCHDDGIIFSCYNCSLEA